MSQLHPSLPARSYTCPDLFERERRAIFSRQWIYAAHAHELPEVRSYVTTDIAGYPIALVRDAEGTIRGYHNVCRHRAAPVIEAGRGTLDKSALSCRYHGWTYDLEGRFIAGPHMGKPSPDRCRALALFPLQVAVHEGFVFVNLDKDAVPFEEDRADLIAEIEGARIDLGDYRFFLSRKQTHRFNWKVWIEGFQECYHCPTVHPIFKKDFSLRAYRVDNKDRFSRHACERRQASDSGSFEGLWLWVFPNLGMPCYEHCLYTLSVMPLSPARTCLTYRFFFREGCSQSQINAFIAFVEQITEEDVRVCEQIQHNLDAGIFERGFLNPDRENGVLYFHSLVREALGGEAL